MKLPQSNAQVEGGMVASVQETVRQGMAAYPEKPRSQWVLEWPGQVVLAVTAIFWTQVTPYTSFPGQCF